MLDTLVADVKGAASDHAAVVGQHLRRIRPPPRRQEPDPPQPGQVFAIAAAQRRVVPGGDDGAVHAHVDVEHLDLVAGGVVVLDRAGQLDAAQLQVRRIHGGPALLVDEAGADRIRPDAELAELGLAEK